MARVVPTQRQSDRKMDRAVRSLMCVFGMNCRRGLDCHCGHTDVEKKLFADKKALREKEWIAPCGFCALGRCRYGAECQRNIRSRLSKEAYEKQSAPSRATESESDYASAELGSDSSDDSADDADAAKPGCEAEGALSAREVAPFLLEDYTKVIKGWRPKVSTVDVGRGGVGELPVFWVLQIVDVPVLPGTAPVQQSIEDTVNFQFTQSGAAAVSQKTQRCEERQQKLMQSEAENLAWDGLTAHDDAASVREFGRSKLSDTKLPKKFQEQKASQLLDLKWSGPGSALDMRRLSAATVLQQRTVRRVGAGRRGEGTAARVALFRDSGGDSSGDGTDTVEKAVVDEAMSAQNKARSLSKLQQWEWRKHMLALQRQREFVNAYFLGWMDSVRCRLFVQLFSRRPYGTRSWLEWAAYSGHEGSYVASDVVAVAGDRVAVGLAAVRQSAATVLRSVMLYRACMVAQGSACARLNKMRGYFWRWMQHWIDRKDLVVMCFRRWMLQWRDQKDAVLFHRIKKLKDVWVELGVGVCEDIELECQMRLAEEFIELRVARDCVHNDRYVRTMVGKWRMMRYTHSLTELLVLDRMVNWWLGLVGQRGCVLVGVRCLCSLWQLTGGATRHWRRAVSEAAVVAAAADAKRAAEDRAASMRRCILQLEEIVLRSRPSGWYRPSFLGRHGHMNYYYEDHFFRTWHSKYLFECYGA